MGFRKGAYATVWSVQEISGVNTKHRISISRKDKQTGEYTDDFSGFVNVYGTAAASKAALLKERDRIQLGDVDVRTKYVKEKNVTYYNFNIYSFEKEESRNSPPRDDAATMVSNNVDNGELDDSNLPF